MARPYLGPALGLLAVLAAAWAFAWATAPDVAPPGSAEAMVAACEGPAREACLEAGLDRVLVQDGQAAAFALLEELVALPDLAGLGHQFAHHLGRTAYAHAADPAVAMADCPHTMGSGCIHGVLEGHFDAVGTNASLSGLCAPRTAGAFGMHQCWHGVGHGLLMAHGYDWRAAVPRCGAAPDFDGRVGCASGVFMENLLGARVQQAAALQVLQGGGDPAGLVVGRDRLRPDEPDFPCKEVQETEAAVGCWQFQPWVVLELTNGSMEAAFEACALAGRYAMACDRGTGQVVSARARIDGDDPLQACTGATNASAVDHCRTGVVMERMGREGDVGPGISLCLGAPEDFRMSCFTSVGVMHEAVQPDPASRWERCRFVPEPERFACAAVRP